MQICSFHKNWSKRETQPGYYNEQICQLQDIHQLCFLGTAGFPGECVSLKGPVLCVHAGDQATTEWMLKEEAPSPGMRNKGQWLGLSRKLEWHGAEGCQVRRCSLPADKEPKSPVPSRWYVCRKKYWSHYLPLQSLEDIWARLQPSCFAVLCRVRGAQYLGACSTWERTKWAGRQGEWRYEMSCGGTVLRKVQGQAGDKGKGDSSHRLSSEHETQRPPSVEENGIGCRGKWCMSHPGPFWGREKIRVQRVL